MTQNYAINLTLAACSMDFKDVLD